MKKTYLILGFIFLTLSAAVAGAGYDHGGHGQKGHSHAKKQVGPNDGRLIHELGVLVEFFVRDDRKLQLAVIDSDGKIVIDDKLSAFLICGSRAVPVHMKFVEEGEVLVSDVALPEMIITPVVLTLKYGEGKKARVKFNVNLSDCGSCDYKEYACICGH